MKKLILVTGDKGGVGKSFTARTLGDYLLTQNVKFRAFDTDRTNATFCRFYPSIVECLDVEEAQDLDTILTELSQANMPFLMDCAARTLESILKWINEIDLFSLQDELGISLALVFVLGPEKDCTQILNDIVKKVGKNAQYLIVKNGFRGRNFELYDQSAVRKKLLGELQAKEIDLPILLEKTALQIDKGNLPWAEAISHPSLQIADRQRVKLFRSKIADILNETALV